MYICVGLSVDYDFLSFSNTPMELIFASMRYGYAEIMHTELLMFVDYDFFPSSIPDAADLCIHAMDVIPRSRLRSCSCLLEYDFFSFL